MLTLITFLLLLNAAYLERFSSIDINVVSAVFIRTLIKQGVLAAIFVGAVLYYVRWMNRWFEEHSSAEFLLKQFQLDVDRASRVVETALEWRRDQKAEIPSPLLDGITRNLFIQREAPEKSSGVDDLASALVGNASQVKVKLGDSEVSLDRKGLNKLAKTETLAPSRRRWRLNLRGARFALPTLQINKHTHRSAANYPPSFLNTASN
jgi:hypothetical protein